MSETYPARDPQCQSEHGMADGRHQNPRRRQARHPTPRPPIRRPPALCAPPPRQRSSPHHDRTHRRRAPGRGDLPKSPGGTPTHARRDAGTPETHRGARRRPEAGPPRDRQAKRRAMGCRQESLVVTRRRRAPSGPARSSDDRLDVDQNDQM